MGVFQLPAVHRERKNTHLFEEEPVNFNLTLAVLKFSRIPNLT